MSNANCQTHEKQAHDFLQILSKDVNNEELTNQL